MTSEDKIFDPHDYDEVPMDENRTSMVPPTSDRPLSTIKPRSPLPPLPSVPKMDSSVEPSDGMYSVVGGAHALYYYDDLILITMAAASLLPWLSE